MLIKILLCVELNEDFFSALLAAHSVHSRTLECTYINVDVLIVAESNNEFLVVLLWMCQLFFLSVKQLVKHALRICSPAWLKIL